MENIPAFGLGTWKIPKGEASEVVYQAIKTVGIRHIDCACDYGNEIEVGFGIRRAIDEGIVTREDLWITSKLWNTYHNPDHVELACRRTLDDLGLSYVDLYLIHFPISMKFVPFETRYPPEWIFDPSSEHPRIEQVQVPVHLTWAAMEHLVELHLTKYIGVCNFNVQLLTDLLSYAVHRPYLNQVEMHPYLTQQPLLRFCQQNAVRVTAFSPLGSPSYIELNMDQKLGTGLLVEDAILHISRLHGKSPAQVLLRWAVQRGTSVVTKSSKVARLAENFAIFDFSLSAEEMIDIDSLNCNLRFNDPGEFCKGMGGAIPIYN